MRRIFTRAFGLFCIFCASVAATPAHARASEGGNGCATLDCNQTTAATARRVMGYRTHYAARASVLITMHDATHIRIATNLLRGESAQPLNAILDNTDARSIADALYNVLSFAYQKDAPDISEEALRAAVARQPIYIERGAYHEALEFFSFADLSNVRMYDTPRAHVESEKKE